MFEAIVNEDPSAKQIRELKEEIAALRAQLTGITSRMRRHVLKACIGAGPGGPANEQELELLRQQLAQRLAENESFIRDLSLSWEEKLRVCCIDLNCNQ